MKITCPKRVNFEESPDHTIPEAIFEGKPISIGAAASRREKLALSITIDELTNLDKGLIQKPHINESPELSNVPQSQFRYHSQRDSVNIDDLFDMPDALPPGEFLAKSFPEKIPGAKSVEKYPTKGARYCLIHNRKRHADPFDYSENGVQNLPEPKKSWKKTIKCQENIKKITEFIVNKYHKDGVFQEGIGRFDVKKQNSKKTYEVLHDHTIMYYFGATGMLAKEGKVQLKQTLDRQPRNYYIKAINAISDNKNDDLFFQRIIEEREDYILQRVMAEGQFMAPVIYGAAHVFGGVETCGDAYKKRIKDKLPLSTWGVLKMLFSNKMLSRKDNIADHNSKMDQNYAYKRKIRQNGGTPGKMSLVVITPYGL